MQIRDHANAVVMLQQLELFQFRHITSSFSPSPVINLITGANASGKTTILEAIHVLFTGRSFRFPRLDPLIQQGSTLLRVVGQYRAQLGRVHVIGLERQLKKTVLRQDGEPIANLSDIAQRVPVHTILPEVHTLLEQGPHFRRQFLDWGVFHVEHDYLPAWQQYHRILRQRNTLLRANAAAKQVEAWDQPFCEYAELLHHARQRYMALFQNAFVQTSQGLLDDMPVIDYRPGWRAELNLAEQLHSHFADDLSRGFTQIGPHRADLSIHVHNKPVSQRLSRGQKKLLVSALRLAHLDVVKQCGGSAGLLLVDDLAAELDRQRRQRLLQALAKANVQTFITATEPELVDLNGWAEKKVFHVEHGKLTEMV